MKKNNLYPVEVKVNAFNGNVEDEPKFVEVEGKKFVDDGSGKPKLDDKQQPIPFEEKKVDVNYSEADLETLAKLNPHVAKILADKAKADKDLSDKLAQESIDKQKALEKNGEWQKLAEERQKEVERLTAEVTQKGEQLGKYKGSVENILKDVMATIPKDRLSLIPEDFSPRQKLEYITKNGKLLGAKVSINATGEGVTPSDDKPAGTDEEKLVNEIEELRKKTTRTASEDKLMFEKATALKKLRAEKAKQ